MMIRKISDFLAGVPMTIVGGVFIAASLVLMLMDISVPVDPAWGRLLLADCHYYIWQYQG